MEKAGPREKKKKKGTRKRTEYADKPPLILCYGAKNHASDTREQMSVDCETDGSADDEEEKKMHVCLMMK